MSGSAWRRLLRVSLSGSLSAALFAATPPPDPAALLAKAVASFERNQKQEVHWNWTVEQSRSITNSSGKQLQALPSVTVESVIRSDGKRCNAVLAWGDGVKPYLLDSDPDARCRATEASVPAFAVTELLKSGRVKLLSRTNQDITIAIDPDRDRLRSADFQVRCAASIRATIHLDPSTFFPRAIEGEVTGNGCDRQDSAPPLYYGETQRGPVRQSFHKGSVFHLEYELQKDRFGVPEHSYWIRVEERYNHIVAFSQGANVIYWGRSVAVTASGRSLHIVLEVRTKAQEFGVDSKVVP